MTDKLKKFIDEHNEELDHTDLPDELWPKIDARLGAKDSSRISSKWLSKIVYLGFSASALLVAIYFIGTKFTGVSEDKREENKENIVAVNSPPHSEGMQGVGENASKEIKDVSAGKNKALHTAILPARRATQRGPSAAKQDGPTENSEVSVETKADSVSTALKAENEKEKVNTAAEKKESASGRKNKKNEIYIPEEPKEMNTYTGTLYESSSLCSVVRAYKFPGKVRDGGHSGPRIRRNSGTGASITVTGCSRLEHMANIKAVWLKGKTDKEIKLPVKKEFKNILLIKSDGRKLNPVAISHYFTGLGVITNSTGRINMVFKEKVELILFFKDAEEGDKIEIDGMIEAVIKKQP